MVKSNTKEKPIVVIEEVKEAEDIPLVAPIESVESEFNPKEDCWNCKNKLDIEGKCDKCGFDISQLYNLELEAEKAREKQKALAAIPVVNK